ncbi:nucleoside diphosphate kinase regulator [Silvimonas iriomotensis]|uniref:Nucleoside diphosphate kinase regulator n=1 Tax=Silvimonas iriomotensis TaxID=449662 RepID=A0ABQ2P6A5_9NEIS|nr:nucleoside diphosphate kinase regulator [Silvimonas iriomotensis]GGP19088.1 nucleoside diphosphate kinase regulator [Silvimonas iriomotensis]
MTRQPTLMIARPDLERLETLIARLPDDLSALENELARAQVVEPEAMPDDVIGMNSTAHFVDDATGASHTFTLVYPQDTDIAAGRISILAPVGSALLGLSVGQTIAWPAPGGRTLQLRVLAVTRQDPRNAR